MINITDIIIIIFLMSSGILNLTRGVVINFGKFINLSLSIIISNLILSNLSAQFIQLNQNSSIFMLSLFLITLALIMILFGFIIEFIIEQTEEFEIPKYLGMTASGIIGILKGFIIISLIIFIFDTTPLSDDSKNTLYQKIEKESFLFKPCKNIKELFFNI